MSRTQWGKHNFTALRVTEKRLREGVSIDFIPELPAIALKLLKFRCLRGCWSFYENYKYRVLWIEFLQPGKSQEKYLWHCLPTTY